MKVVINNPQITIAKTWKQAKHLSMDEWIKKAFTYANFVIIYTHVSCLIYTNIMGYYIAIKKKEILLFMTTWMNLDGYISQTEKDKFHTI